MGDLQALMCQIDIVPAQPVGDFLAGWGSMFHERIIR